MSIERLVFVDQGCNVLFLLIRAVATMMHELHSFDMQQSIGKVYRHGVSVLTRQLWEAISAADYSDIENTERLVPIHILLQS